MRAKLPLSDVGWRWGKAHTDKPHPRVLLNLIFCFQGNKQVFILYCLLLNFMILCLVVTHDSGATVFSRFVHIKYQPCFLIQLFFGCTYARFPAVTKSAHISFCLCFDFFLTVALAIERERGLCLLGLIMCAQTMVSPGTLAVKYCS